MEWSKRQHSRLGQILLARRLISQEQLDQAIREQDRTGQRLGEVLAAMQLITQAQIGRAMRRQRNLRLAAALATSLLAPLQAYAALAAAPVAVASARTQRELSDEELGEVAGQGRDDGNLSERLREQALRAQLQMAALTAANLPAHAPDAAPSLPRELAKLFNPLAGLLNAETSVSDVAYDPEQSSAVVNKDGSVTLRLPTTIGEIKFRNIRVGQATSGPSFGSIALHDIDLRGTTITVTPRGPR